MMSIFKKIPFDNSDCYFYGQRLKLDKAPEPLDILWENLETQSISKSWIRFKSFLVYLLLISISFWILVGIAILQNKIQH